MPDPDPILSPGSVSSVEELTNRMETETRRRSLWRLLIGRPRSLHDRSLVHRLSLIAFLAWVGLGADGLSSAASASRCWR